MSVEESVLENISATRDASIDLEDKWVGTPWAGILENARLLLDEAVSAGDINLMGRYTNQLSRLVDSADRAYVESE